ncbi:MAG TPA: ABC transporter permease [Chloroflexota bacterium]|nr:ABC transporter permease [Chloroflexota bacterium]
MLGLAEAVAAWLVDPAHWAGSDGIGARVLQHLALSGTALGISLALALPLGVALGHTGRGAWLAINAANVGRALPSLAILALVLPLVFRLRLGLGFWPTVFMLVPLGAPLILVNAYVAVRAVDRDVVDVARGLGMTGWQVLRRVELPLAAPVIVDGVRNAAVSIVATATLGAIVASGGLGRYIVDGLARLETPRLVAGALLVAVLSMATEWVFGALERLVVPRGVRAQTGA